ncbi:MAG: conjugal transfer relaxase/helicase TraA, partial [Simkania sp.]|nr:conjugal transfer relaxase/helicase TraA [Simkania sp.]
ISEGDRIEFRKNDRELGVTNGMSGVLLKAEKNRFSVAVQEHGKKTRIVAFNPEEYHRFQLGYASTCSRAQGRTVQNAYVLHSPHLNKQMAYVGLTRHVKDVHYFVSKEDALNLSDLKRKALRDGSKATTLEYTYTREVEGALFRQKKEKAIQGLKESKHFSDRIKGRALNLWDRFNEKTYAYLEKKQDRKLSKEFFNFKEDPKEQEKTTVRKITPEELQKLSIIPVEAYEKVSPQEITIKISEQDQAIEINKERVKMKHAAIEIEKDLYDQNTNPSDSSKSFEKDTLKWRDLPKEKRKLLSSYFTTALKAQELREVVQAECGESLENASKSPHFQEWLKACALRNESAYQLKSLLSKEGSREILKEKSVYYIETHAKKHKDILKSQEQKALQVEKMKDLEGQLGCHVESLLYKLFPDGPSSKTAQGYRFGSKGSLVVSHSGPKAGQYYDFERQEGGGLLKLISRELKLDSHEARVWAGEFLGVANEIQLPAHFQKPTISSEKESDWASVKPDPKALAPKLEEQGKLSYYYKEVMRHPYHDEKGNLLYYVTRLQDNNNPSRKITPPLSYGYFKNNPKQLSWERRGYKDENGKKPL